MQDLPQRKAFNFFRSYYEVFKELPTKSAKAEFIEALLDKQFNFEEPKNLKGLSKFAYISQKHSINAQVEGYITKCTKKPNVPPTAPPTVGLTVPPTVQEKGQEKEKVKVIVKDIESRKEDFINSLAPYVARYSKEMLNNFFLYWSEHNEKGKKMRFEMSKNQPFNIERRLVTWKKRERPSDSSNKSQIEQAVERGENAKDILKNLYENE